MKLVCFIIIVTFFSLIAFAKKDNTLRVADKLLTTFDQFIQGEFDNYNQVNFEHNDFLPKEDIPEYKHDRLYQKNLRIHSPQLGQYVYYHQLHNGSKHDPIYRRSISVVTLNYNTNTLLVKNYRIKDVENFIKKLKNNNLADLSINELKVIGNNCDSEFSLIGNSFVGGVDKNKCKAISRKFDYINLATQQVYNAQSFWHLEEGFIPSGKMLFGRTDDVPHKLNRVKYFTCWAAFKTNQKMPNGKYKWDFFPDLMLHNQGDIALFSTTDKKPKHYTLRLKETIFPASNRPNVFEMFIYNSTPNHEDFSNKALSYTWTDEQATRLGINLRWMQASCHLRGEL